METRDRLFIGNEWVAPATDRTIDVISPITEEVYARTPDGSPADIDRAVAAARDAFDNGPWPNWTPDERADAIAALSQALQKRGAQIADIVTNENGSPASQSLGMQVFAATMVLDIYADIARSYPWSDERVGAMGQKVVVRRAPVGVAGGDHSVECAAVHHGDEARAVPGVGLDDGAQAGARDGARPVPARRGGARGRPSARRDQHRHGVARGQRAHRHPPRRRQGQLHRYRRRRAHASASCAAGRSNA